MEIVQQIAGSTRKKIVGVSRSTFFIPDEMVLEILSLLEAKSVLRCKCVCKRWYALIQLKFFAEMRWKRGKFIVFKGEVENINFDGIKETYKYICYCDGFLLERRLSSSLSSANYRISNPSTRQILDLPDPHEIALMMFIYLHSSTNSYKVVSMFLERESRHIKFEVLDVGNGYDPNEVLTWRTLTIPNFHNLTRDEISSFYVKIPMISTKGNVCLFRIRKEGLSDAELICIDMDKEVCTTYTASRSLFCDWENVKFMLWNDMPSVLGIVEDTIVAWVLEDYKTQKWSQTKLAIPSMYLKNFREWKMVVPTCIDGGDVIIFEDDVLRFAYHVSSRKWCQMSKDSIFEEPETFLTLKSNTVLENVKMSLT